MDEQYGISAFEYVELVERYKEDEYIPSADELEKLEQMVKDYYNSKEFREYVENYTPLDGLSEEQIDEVFAEHNAHEAGFDIDAINESVKLKYTDNDILDVLDGIAGPTLKSMIMSRLNDVWNIKNGVE
jgi:uncharacterized protein (UPF0335 family)